MRSSLLGECFGDPEEQEFLTELAEAGLAEAHEALTAHLEDPVDSAFEAACYIENLARQERRIKFLDLLLQCLRG